jgi:2-polyprenyl-6-methoxyphenol hydroxylase-like FAD-dependent oxidoreductase
LEELKQSIAELIPQFADRVDELRDWEQVKLLSVQSNRLRHWYRPGLLLIGDAAHAMSPIGGVGINLAIQDAVVAANVLAEPLRAGRPRLRDLRAVQRRRELPTRVIQGIQTFFQQRVIASILSSTDAQSPLAPLRAFLALLRLPLVRDLPGRLVGFGIWPAHVKQRKSGARQDGA